MIAVGLNRRDLWRTALNAGSHTVCSQRSPVNYGIGIKTFEWPGFHMIAARTQWHGSQATRDHPLLLAIVCDRKEYRHMHGQV